MSATEESCLRAANLAQEKMIQNKDNEIKRLKMLADVGEEALFLLDRFVWQMSDGHELSGGNVSDTVYDLALGLLERTKVRR